MFYDFRNSGSIGKVKHNLTNKNKIKKKTREKKRVNVKKMCARPQPQPRPRLDPDPDSSRRFTDTQKVDRSINPKMFRALWHA